AGEKPAVERACVLAKEAGAKRALPLPVSVPSHCALMQPAADQLAKTLANISLQTPVTPVIQNVSAQAFDQPQDIKQALVAQLYSPVQWVQTLAFFEAQGVSEYVECGPGNVLAGLGKRTVSGNWQNAEALIAKES
ncbi:MAG: ACP S-malonyltransferase, partial [Pseudomonadota bacterium]|nr:ACP S-malonyltransferase [Pseudomonadota bacterium]